MICRFSKTFDIYTYVYIDIDIQNITSAERAVLRTQCLLDCGEQILDNVTSVLEFSRLQNQKLVLSCAQGGPGVRSGPLSTVPETCFGVVGGPATTPSFHFCVTAMCAMVARNAWVPLRPT